MPHVLILLSLAGLIYDLSLAWCNTKLKFLSLSQANVSQQTWAGECTEILSPWFDSSALITPHPCQRGWMGAAFSAVLELSSSASESAAKSLYRLALDLPVPTLH